MLQTKLALLRAKKPIIHNITNYVTVHSCANIILAAGAAPIMADAPEEAEDIISICDALVINIGTLNQRTIESMFLAGKKANALGKPVILGPVGNGASPLRTQTVNRLLQEVQFAVIRGNISEIKMAAMGVGNARGVEADSTDAADLGTTAQLAKNLAKQTGAVIAITGEVDVVANPYKAYAIRNGHAKMGAITGSGCMCNALISCFAALERESGDYLDATATAVAMMGLAGEIAYANTFAKGLGNGSFDTAIIDAISLLDDQSLKDGMKIELL